MGQAWQLKPAGGEDLAAIVEIMRAEDLRYRGRADIDLAQARRRIAGYPHFDFARDQTVATVGGEAVAAAVLTPRSLNISVHPDHESRALRCALLDWGERRQCELGRTPLRVAVPASNAPAVRTVTEAGYQVERFYASMIRDFGLSGPPEPVALPSGYRLSLIEPKADLVALHTLDDRAFCTRPDYVPETIDEYDRSHIAVDTFAPEWSFIAKTASGEPVGSLIGSRRSEPSLGYIAIIAVDPDHQGRGLGRNLLLAAFAAIRAAGHQKAELHVASDNPRAVQLYTGVGMIESERFDHYVKSA